MCKRVRINAVREEPVMSRRMEPTWACMDYRVRTNVVRDGSVVSRRMEPAWARMIWRERARPTPVPSARVVKKGSKIWSAFSGGIGSPLLEMWISVLSEALTKAVMRIRGMSAVMEPVAAEPGAAEPETA